MELGAKKETFMNTHKYIFICGLHRSGTSLLYKILKQQEQISGMSETKAPEDEGQHLQSVFLPAKSFGGPGRFGFNKASFLDEESKLINESNKNKLFNEWSKFWDLEKEYLIEKSPPNLVRTKFLQEMFPESYFIILLRHPIATSLATKKWSKTSHYSLVKHWITCHDQCLKDKSKIKNYIDIKYEELIEHPDKTLNKISKFLGTEISKKDIEIKTDINDKYFNVWRKKKCHIFYKRNIQKTEKYFEKEINRFGYSFNNTL